MLLLKDLVRKVKDLPPLPDIVVKLLQASRDPDASVREMVELIKHDPALTTKVLRLCNSSYYGLPRKINSIQEALVYIGTDTLVNFILAGCLAAFYQQSQDGYGLESGDLWRHSVGCAIAAQLLSPADDDALKSEAFTAGLLHDVGKIILSSFVGDKMQEIMDIVKDEDIPFEKAERRILGFSHTEAGAQMAKMWNLPEPLIEAISLHQTPQAAVNHKRLVAQVHVANILCISFGIGIGTDGLAYSFDPSAMEELELNSDDLYAISVKVHDQFSRAEDMIGLIAPTGHADAKAA